MDLRFGECEVSLDRRELRRAGELVPVEPQVFDVLAFLLRHRERVVPKHELLDEVWGDRFVSESALTSRIKSARRAVGDTGRDQRIIRTVHARGYRFVADLEAGSPAAGAPATGAPAAGDPGRTGTRGDERDDRLVAAIEDVARGAELGAAIEIEGGRRTGKTRLLDRAADIAVAQGLVVGRGRAGGLGVRPFRSVQDALREMVERRHDLLETLPVGCRIELERAFAGLPVTRQRLIVAAREALVAAAADGGAVLLLDDMHLADEDSVWLAGELARVARRHRAVVAAAHRPGHRLGAPFELSELVAVAGAAGDPEDRLPPDVRDALQLVALAGPRFDRLDLTAATGRTTTALAPVVAAALEAGVLDQAGDDYRFVDPESADRLVEQLSAPRRAAARQELATRLAAGGAEPGRVADQLLAAGTPGLAAPFALAAARRAADAQFPAEVLRWTDVARGHVEGTDETALLSLRADALATIGDPGAVATYRQALAKASPDAAPGLRARLARAALYAGDLSSAEEALRGLAPTGGPDDGSILLAIGMLAYFSGDLERAEDAVEKARSLALAPGASDRLLDVITLQGMIAHSRGEWFDRLRRELRATRDNPQLAVTVFDSHLCVAEYLLYGPTPYDEVVALAHDLRRRAERTGARRAVAFAVTVAGEAALLAGDLDTARRDLTEAVELHRESGGDTGIAHALQRLAEVELAAGERAEAERLLRRALPLARWSPLARHLLQRIYGTLIGAAADADTAVGVVREAVETMDGPTACLFCQVMVAVPAAIATAEAGRLDEARDFLAQAEASASLWRGTSWQAAVDEARSALARAEGDEDEADRLLARAASLFEAAGQPLDVERCVEALRDQSRD